MGDILLSNGLNYKLINICLVFIIFLIIYLTRDFFGFVFDVFKPIIFSLIISYIFNLYLKMLNRFFNKFVSIILFFITIIILFFILYLLFGQIVDQLSNISNIFFLFFKDIFMKYNFNFLNFYDKISSFTLYLPKFFNNVFKYLSLVVIIISSSIYFFIDFNRIKVFLKKLSFYSYLKVVNDSLESYMYSFMLLSFINVIEYSVIFFIIGHPNFLILGLLSGILSLIPIFGGLITNGVAVITAFIINYRLFIRTLIAILILTIIDGYIIGPIVYSKTNKIHPLVVILSIYVGGKIMGFVGIIFSLPVMVVLLSLYKKIKNM